MKLFHGSNMPIDTIELSRSKRGKDFGCGFYLSDNYTQAYHMACLTTERNECGTPEVTTFDFDYNCIKDGSLKVKQFDSYSEEWAEFVLSNRQNMSRINVHDYDIVIGPIANDKVGVQIRRFILGDITVKQLVEELRFRHGLTMQYFFSNEHAIKLLKKI